MLKLVVVDSTAQARNRIVRQFTEFLNADIKDLALIPRVTIKPLSPQELKFHAAPDICVVGDEIASREVTTLASIRKLLPDTPILVRLNSACDSLTAIENLAAMGADDTISENVSAIEFFKKVLILAKKRRHAKPGQLILVDSGKGGIGVTTVAAGLAEALMEGGRKVAVLDFDFESQDLARFLQTKPFINENLQLLFDQSRPITEEFVSQCLVPVWEEHPYLYCMPPIAESEDLYDVHASYSRMLLSILEIIDASFDSVVIDSGSARGALLKTLYRVADKVVFVVNNDPATLYACAERITRLKSMMAPNAELLVVENAAVKHGLPAHIMKREFSSAAKLDEREWFDGRLMFCRHGNRWPGSGDTIYSAGTRQMARALTAIGVRLKLIDAEFTELPSAAESPGILTQVASRLFARKQIGTQSAEIRIEQNKLSQSGSKSPEVLIAEAPKSEHADDSGRLIALDGFKSGSKSNQKDGGLHASEPGKPANGSSSKDDLDALFQRASVM